ncbi:MAG: zinc ribbon domain-containing protein [Bacteroidaceae bacterium]|nr:zinc ribbon domain-containing protein [Bacteroidaceae bacterium]
MAVACTDNDKAVVEGEGVIYADFQSVDSVQYSRTHHYWKGQYFHTLDTLVLLSSVPNESWLPDAHRLAKRQRIVVADIVRLPGNRPDSIWLKMVSVDDTIPVQGWADEATLLAQSRPTNILARILHPFGSLADVPGGKYSHAWLDFYFHPTANPWLLPLPLAAVVAGLWALLIFLLGFIDKYIFDRARYRCGQCNAPLRHLGRCPHCGAINENEEQGIGE